MICADSMEWMQTTQARFAFTCIDPPYGHFPLINDAIAQARIITDGATVAFMYPEDVQQLNRKPDQICHWIKPFSTKNTTKRYSRFVESLCFYDLERSPFNQDTHWFARSGIFQDSFSSKQVHPFQKPDSLIEKLLVVHTAVGDSVLDPFCGSGVVERVGQRMGRRVTSIDIDPQWAGI